MAHRDGATGAADTVDPQGPARDDAVEDAVTAPDAQGAPDAAEAPDATAPAGDPATETAAPAAAGETAPGPARKPRLPRPATGRTPAFGLSLAAMRQRASGGSEGTDELRRNLADKEAQTAELREALDALRQALDDTTPPKGPDAVPAAAGRRRRPLLVLLAVLAVVAVVVAVVATRGSGGGTAAKPSPSTSATASQAPSGTTSVTPSASAPSVTPSSPPAPAVTTTPMPWRGETLLTPPAAATAGPGVDTPGTDLTVAIDADLKHVDVFERAVLKTPQSAVTLALPPATAWGDALAAAEPVVSDLQVVLDGVAVRPQRTDAGWFALPANGGTVTKIELRYRVAGTFVTFAGSKKDRRSIGVPSFTGQGSLDAATTMHVTVDDPRVENVYCLSATTGTGICANGGSDGLTANVQAGSSPVVLLQADVVPLG